MKPLFYINPAFLFLLWISPLRAQKGEGFKYEITLSTDNDALVAWQNKDRYYSFGLGTEIAFKSDRLLGLEKLFPSKSDHFFSTEVKAEGYTPTNKFASIELFKNPSSGFDRPFAGILYGNFKVNYAFKRSFVDFSVLAGVMGPLSSSDAIQEWFHKEITGGSVFDAWKYQISNQFIFNLRSKIVYDFTPKNNWIDLFGSAEGQLGNLYIDFTSSLGLRIGKFGEINQTVAFGNSILSKNKKFELYLQSSIGTTLAAFNGTAQGNIFRRNSENTLDTINHSYIKASSGIYFSYHKVSIALDHFFSFGEVIPNEDHVYARFIAKFRF